MRIKLTLLAILLITILSCKNKENEIYRKVTFYDYQIWLSDLNKIDLRDSLVGYTTKTQDNEITTCKLEFPQLEKEKDYFGSEIRNLVYTSFVYEIKESHIIIDNISCKTIDTISIAYLDNQIDLFVSEYDRENSCDEESFIYWNNQIGIIAQYNYPMGALFLFEYDDFKDLTKVYFYNYIIHEEKQKKLIRDM